MSDANSCESSHTGQVKWFNHTLGYGFLSNISDNSQPDIFVHHSELNTDGKIYKTLYQGEYVEYQSKMDADGKKYATHITGIKGNKLMCEFRGSVKVD